MAKSEAGKTTALPWSNGSDAAATTITVIHAGDGGSLVVPHGTFLLDADFIRQGSDLLLVGPDGVQVLVQDYFAVAYPPALMTAGGAVLQPGLVARLAGPLAPGQYAQLSPDSDDQPIGEALTVDGVVTATRADGSQVTLVVGDAVFQGDVIETEEGGAVGIEFIDDTTFSLGEDARMVLDEMIYDPVSGDGAATFSMVQGAFVFITGEIASINPQGMVIETPVASIGIRGTKVAGVAAQEGELNTVTLLAEDDGSVGSILVSNAAGETLLTAANQSVQVSSFSAAPAVVQLSASEIENSYGNVLRIQQQTEDRSSRSRQDNNEDGAEGDNEENGEESGEAEPGEDADESEDGEPGEGEPAEGDGDGEEGDEDTEGSLDGEGEFDGEGEVAADGEGGPGPDGEAALDGDGEVPPDGEGEPGPDGEADLALDGEVGPGPEGGGDPVLVGDGTGDIAGDPTLDGGDAGDPAGDPTLVEGGTGDPTLVGGGDGDFAGDPALVGDGGGDGDFAGDTSLDGGATDGFDDGSTAGFDATFDSGADTFSSTSYDSYDSGGFDGGFDPVFDGGFDDGLGSFFDPYAPATDPYDGVDDGGIESPDDDPPPEEIFFEDNIQPFAFGDLVITNITGGSGFPVSVPIFALLSNDFDPDGDPLNLVSAGGDASGSAIPSGGAVVFTPVGGSFVGNPAGSFSYTISDGNGAANNADVASVSIEAVVGATLTGTAASEIFIGDGSADTITGNAGDDFVFGGAGNDTLIAGSGAGNDFYDGGTGSDTITYTSDSFCLIVDLTSGFTSGNSATIGFDTLNAIENITGGTGDDDLTGNAVANIIIGGAGDDILEGRAGVDTLNGGGGTDVARYDLAAAGIVIDLSSNSTTTDGDGFSDTLSGIEDVIGSNFNDTITGDTGVNALAGLAGNDTLEGGAGIDTVTYANAAAGVTVDLLGDSTSDDGDGATDNLASIENVIGSAFADFITGDAGANTLSGGNGNDTFIFTDSELATAVDTVIGGAGTDIINVTDAVTAIDADFTTISTVETIVLADAAGQSLTLATLSDAAGIITIDASALTTGNAITVNAAGRLVGLAVTSGGGDDTLVGGGGGDTFNAGAGDDALEGNIGVDTLNGGADTITYANAAGAISVDLSANAVSNDGDGGSDTLTSIENVTGSAFSDVIIGDTGVNILTGGAGNDHLTGGAGVDAIDGGAGTLDIANYLSAAAGIVVNLASGTATDDGDGASDTLAGIEQVIGSLFADNIVGDSGANTLLASDGDDVLEGGGGVDTLDGGVGADLVNYVNAAAGVVVDLGAGSTSDDGDGASDTLTSIEDATGSAFGDLLIGSSVANVLLGGGGDDFLEGLAGIDTLNGGAGSDTIKYVSSAAGITVDLGSNSVSDDGEGANDTLASIENVIGSAFADTIIGDGGANSLDGGAGDDTLTGGGGSDCLVGGSGDDTLDGSIGGAGDDSLDGGAGIDTVDFSTATALVNVNLTAGLSSGDSSVGNDSLTSIENVAGSGFDDNITGDANVNVLAGGAGNDTIDGAAGNDAITGGAGDDSILGSAGIDDINGGAGDDTIDGGTQDDIISFDAADVTGVTGGAGNDTLRVDGTGITVKFGVPGGASHASFELVDLTGTGNNILQLVSSDILTLADANSLTVNGVSGDSVSAGLGWNLVNASVVIGSDNFSQYSRAGATLFVDNDITQTAVGLLTTTFELSDLDGGNGFTLNGIAANDSLGRSVAGAGDIDGDGFADIISGAAIANSFGEVYVVHGKAAAFGATVSASTLNGTDGFALLGVSGGDQAGASVDGIGDINGDGFGDLIIGAPIAESVGTNRGETYVVFGTSTAFGATVDLSTLDGTNGFRLNGIADTDLSGRAVGGAGDINGDGLEDIIIGADYADPSGVLSGEAYIVFGSTATFAASFDLSSLDGTNGLTVTGVTANDLLGKAVSGAGDVNDDGYGDFLVAAPTADPNGTDSGAVAVVFGAATSASSITASSLDGTNGFVINGVAAGDRLGTSVADAGDINGDGFADIIVGAHLSDTNGTDAGAAYIVFGKASGFSAILDLSTLDGANGLTINGIAAGDYAGRAVAGAGDVNGDGFDDVLIGAPKASPNGTDSGEVYIIFGAASGLGSVFELSNLDGINGLTLAGIAADDFTGVSVEGAGDVNGDGFDDMIIGAYRADVGGITQAGVSHTVFGQDFRGDVTHQGTTANDSLTGTSGANVINGGQGDDTLVGGAGNDVIIGGSGDDIITFDAADILKVDGGGGTDTLLVNGSGVTVDLTAISDHIFTNFETIDITGSGDNTLIFDIGDVVRMTNGFNAVATFGTSLIVAGNAGDVVNGGNGWSLEDASFVISANNFSVYEDDETYLLVDNDIDQSQIILEGIDLTALDGAIGFTIQGVSANDKSGFSVDSAGDLNGDGFADLFIGAPTPPPTVSPRRVNPISCLARPAASHRHSTCRPWTAPTVSFSTA